MGGKERIISIIPGMVQKMPEVEMGQSAAGSLRECQNLGVMVCENQGAKMPQGQGAEEEDQIVGLKFEFEFGPAV